MITITTRYDAYHEIAYRQLRSLAINKLLMKTFIMAGLLLFLMSPYKCAEENEETTEIETNGRSYDAEDTEARTAIADWEKFLVQSEAVVNDACVKISQATDRMEFSKSKHKGKSRSAIIEADERMGKLSDMLLDARKIKPENYRFDEATLRDIERFKQEFRGKQEEMEEALRQLEAK